MTEWCMEHWGLTFALAFLSILMIGHIIGNVLTIVNNIVACKYDRKIKDND